MQRVTQLCWLPVGLILLLAFVLSVTEASCPNNCNPPNGRCQRNKCVCTGQYAGDDCSYVYAQLDGRGTALTGSVPTFGWAYYYMQANAGTELIFNVNQTSSDGDCDVYINRIAFPTRSAWIRRDISTKKEMQIVLGKTETTETGRYIAGVYGFVACEFSVSGVNKGTVSCPKNCSNHGTCGATGECSCNPGWHGLACDTSSTLSSDGTPIQDTVQRGEWKYYSTMITTVPTLLTYTLNQTTVRGDLDLYVRYGSAPTLTQYSAANTSMVQASTVLLEALQAGTYFVGVFGFWDSGSGTAMGYTLSLVADKKTDCKNTTKCSMHGTCGNKQCQCRQEYTGKDCEEKKDPIVLGQRVTGYVADSMWNYYHYVGTSNKEVTVSLTQDASTPAGDCDIYVKGGSKPTQMSYDYAELGSETVFNVTIPEPLDTTWYIGVFGWYTCAYSLVAVNRDTKSCNNGTWDPDIDGCVCNPGWTGDNCDVRTNELKNGEVRTGVVTYNEWQYYTINLRGTHSLEVRMREDNSTVPGSAWLYVSVEGFPTLHTYDKSDTTNHQVHSIAVTSKNDPLYGDVYIGIYGSPYATHSQTISYSIVAWYPEFR